VKGKPYIRMEEEGLERRRLLNSPEDDEKKHTLHCGTNFWFPLQLYRPVIWAAMMFVMDIALFVCFNKDDHRARMADQFLVAAVVCPAVVLFLVLIVFVDDVLLQRIERRRLRGRLGHYIQAIAGKAKGPFCMVNFGCQKAMWLLELAPFLHDGGTAIGEDMWGTQVTNFKGPAIAKANVRKKGMSGTIVINSNPLDIHDPVYPSNSFDVVFHTFLFDKLRLNGKTEELPQLVSEMVRILKPGGLLISMNTRMSVGDFRRCLKKAGIDGNNKISSTLHLSFIPSIQVSVYEKKASNSRGGANRSGGRKKSVTRHNGNVMDVFEDNRTVYQQTTVAKHLIFRIFSFFVVLAIAVGVSFCTIYWWGNDNFFGWPSKFPFEIQVGERFIWTMSFFPLSLGEYWFSLSRSSKICLLNKGRVGFFDILWISIRQFLLILMIMCTVNAFVYGPSLGISFLLDLVGVNVTGTIVVSLSLLFLVIFLLLLITTIIVLLHRKTVK